MAAGVGLEPDGQPAGREAGRDGDGRVARDATGDGERAGVRGLAHALGPRASIALAWGSFAAALVLAAVLGLFLDYAWGSFLPGASLAATLFAGAVAAYLRQPGRAGLQLGFGLIGIATASLAVGWLAAVT